MLRNHCTQSLTLCKGGAPEGALGQYESAEVRLELYTLPPTSSVAFGDSFPLRESLKPPPRGQCHQLKENRVGATLAVARALPLGNAKNTEYIVDAVGINRAAARAAPTRNA